METLKDINLTTFENVFIICTLIWVISLIVLLIMTRNISSIKKELKHLNKRIAPRKSDHEFLGAREAYKGYKNAAVDHYLNFMYEIAPYMKTKRVNPVWKKRHDMIRDKIRKLKIN